jgi:hypothetical protein
MIVIVEDSGSQDIHNFSIDDVHYSVDKCDDSNIFTYTRCISVARIVHRLPSRSHCSLTFLTSSTHSMIEDGNEKTEMAGCALSVLNRAPPRDIIARPRLRRRPASRSLPTRASPSAEVFTTFAY